MRRDHSLTVSLIAFVVGVLCLMMVFAGCSASTLGRKLNLGVAITASADVVSSEYAKAHGGKEANSIIGDSFLRHALLKAGVVSAVLLGSQAVESSHQTWSQILRAIPVIAWTAASLMNTSFSLRSRWAQ